MSEPLPPWLIDQIRDACERDLPLAPKDVLALCDTVESLRAGLDVKLKALERMARDFAVVSGSGGALLSTVRELEEAEAELKVLRGIAKRLAEDWQPTVLWTGPKTYRFEWTNDEGEDDPMTEAEVRVIYVGTYVLASNRPEGER